MSDLYVRSTDGDNADTGATWALAEADLHTPTWAAGDRVFVSDNHAQSTAAAITIATAGTLASPTQVLCVDDTANPEPPTATATTATVTTTGANSIAITGCCHVSGITFVAGSGSGTGTTITVGANDVKQKYSNCGFQIATTATGGRINCTSSVDATEFDLEFKDVTLKFANAGQYMQLSHVRLRWDGGGLASGGTSPTTLITVVNAGADIEMSNLDLSAAGAAINLFTPSGAVGKFVVRDSVMPASWSGSITSSVPTTTAQRFELYNVDSADTNYRLWLRDYTGDVTSDDALYRAPGLGASSWMYNGATQVVGISHKFATTANAKYPLLGLVGQELAGLNTTIDPTTSHVVTCYFTTPGQADFTPLSNKDIGLTVQYPGTAGSPLGKSANDLVANVLTAEADQDADTTGDWDDALGAWAASTAYSVGAVVRPTTRNGKTYYCSVAGTSHTVEPTWLTTEGGETSEGGGTAKWRCMHRQKMVVTLDATAGKVRERGWLHLTPVMYLASAVAWVDPQASVTSS